MKAPLFLRRRIVWLMINRAIMTGIKVVDPSWRANGPGEAQHTGTATWPSAGHSGHRGRGFDAFRSGWFL